MDAKESLQMLLQAVETHSIDRAEDTVGRFIDLFNSNECHKFLQDKLTAIRKGLTEIERSLNDSLFSALQSMRKLVVENRIHIWSQGDWMTQLSLSAQSLHYILTKASDVLKKKELSDKQKITEIWDGLTKPLDQAEDKENASRKFESYLQEWRRYCKLPNAEARRREQQMREDFRRGCNEQKSALENLFDNLRKDFKELKDKLLNAQNEIKNAEDAKLAASVGTGAAAGLASGIATGAAIGTIFGPVGIPVGAAIGAIAGIGSGLAAKKGGEKIINKNIRKRAGDRFVNRKDKQWYPSIENSLFDYIRGKTTDDDIQKLIQKERLDEDLENISVHMGKWISRSRNMLDRVNIPKLNKQAFVCEIRRSWTFAKAVLLEDEENAQLHSKLLEKVINIACSSDGKITPFVSMGRIPDGSTSLQLKFVVTESASRNKVNDFVRSIADIAGGSFSTPEYAYTTNTIVYDITFSESDGDGIRKFIGKLISRMGSLTEVHARAVLLGDYDVNTGSRLTSPAFNRIYGEGLSAPGFRPTVFGYLDYSGERYFCPTGWRRISINVAESAAEFDTKYGGWHVAYHGTNHELAATILTSGFMASPGCYSEGEDVVYLSPSIVYASHPRYARVYEVPHRSGKPQYMQMILQVRVNPNNVWKKEGGTLPGAFPGDSQPADPNFPQNQNLEWLVKPIPGANRIDMFAKAFVIYGIMIRVSDDDPNEAPENAWWKKR